MSAGDSSANEASADPSLDISSINSDYQRNQYGKRKEREIASAPCTQGGHGSFPVVNGETNFLPKTTMKVNQQEQRTFAANNCLKSTGSYSFYIRSLPDLAREQRQSMKKISEGEGPKIKYVERNVQKKRKYHTFEKWYVRNAAQEFLKKAAYELLSENNCRINRPLQSQVSHEDARQID